MDGCPLQGAFRALAALRGGSWWAARFNGINLASTMPSNPGARGAGSSHRKLFKQPALPRRLHTMLKPHSLLFPVVWLLVRLCWVIMCAV